MTTPQLIHNNNISVTDSSVTDTQAMAAGHGSDDEERMEEHIRSILQLLGEDPSREGLIETPRRVRQAWDEWTKGYTMDPTAVLKSFEHVGSQSGEVVLMTDIPVYSMCEHHLAPFFGVAHIAYTPTDRIVGLSKL